ncbi:MAG: hypothetical protein JWO04_2205 [Gammaproteobacteria bacterium]|jgi:hypothetical protein|nr:hypothetical protein [Gammaproteobacteria bacterium]
MTATQCLCPSLSVDSKDSARKDVVLVVICIRNLRSAAWWLANHTRPAQAPPCLLGACLLRTPEAPKNARRAGLKPAGLDQSGGGGQ